MDVRADAQGSFKDPWGCMSYSLNSLNGVLRGIIYGSTVGVIKGDTKTSDYGSYEGRKRSLEAPLEDSLRLHEQHFNDDLPAV